MRQFLAVFFMVRGAGIVAAVFRWIPVYFAMLFAATALWVTIPRGSSDAFNGDEIGAVTPIEPIDIQGEPQIEPPIEPPIEMRPPILYDRGLSDRDIAGTDNRVPVEALSDVWGLDDPELPAKLSGIGKLEWRYEDSVSTCTASLIHQRMVITAAHCVTEDGLSAEPQKLWFYSVACDSKYRAQDLYVKTHQPIGQTDIDYAYLLLESSTCPDAVPFQAVTLTDETALEIRERSYPLLSLSVFPFAATERHGEFPLAQSDALARYKSYTAFGVFCRLDPSQPTVSDIEDAFTHKTEGCSNFPGNSGGPLLVSLDFGATYQIFATNYGSIRGSDGRLGVYPRIRGEYARDLERIYSAWGLGAAHGERKRAGTS